VLIPAIYNFVIPNLIVCSCWPATFQRWQSHCDDYRRYEI